MSIVNNEIEIDTCNYDGLDSLFDCKYHVGEQIITFINLDIMAHAAGESKYRISDNAKSVSFQIPIYNLNTRKIITYAKVDLCDTVYEKNCMRTWKRATLQFTVLLFIHYDLVWRKRNDHDLIALYNERTDK